MKRMTSLIFSLILAACCLEAAEAQSAIALSGDAWGAYASRPCMIHFPICTGDQPPWPNGTAYLDDGLPTVCKNAVAPSNRCVSAAGTDETAPGPHCPACEAGSPINLANGNTYITQADLRVSGLAGGLAITRTWNSRWPSSQSSSSAGRFGLNWRSSYEERIIAGSDGTMKYAREDGSFWSFGVTSIARPIVYVTAAPANGRATLAPGANSWTVAYKNGEQRLFDNTTGQLTMIVDRNGNATQLAYDSLGRLTTVTDPALRHLFFNYANGSSTLVSTITSDVGISLAYSYDSQGKLVQVTKPDGTTVAFEYDANANITAVKDSDGKILEQHTYDSSGRGLSSSRAGGVDALTISYP